MRPAISSWSTDELERRERARRDRPIGGARRDFENVYRLAAHDCEVDGRDSPGANAERVIKAWQARLGSGAFDRLAARGRP